MAKHKHSSDVKKLKHFLLGAGLALVVIFVTSSVFAESLVQCGSLGKIATQAECDAADKAAGKEMLPFGQVKQINPQFGQTTAVPQQSSSSQPSPPSPPSGPPSSQSGPPAFSAQQLESDIASGMLKADTQIPCPSLGNQLAKASDCLSAAKGQTSQQQSNIQKPAAEEKAPEVGQKVDKSKLSSAKNPSATLAQKGLKNVEKSLNILSKKFNKQKTKMKQIAVVRSVAKGFMKLCTKYTPSAAQDEEFDDEESFTCDEFVADLSEPIAAALKSKDADLAFELTYDALNINFKELFNSLIQQ